ncbi:MAP kinase-activated protein kinase 2 (Fragment) [Seminavis robusta]|uniref:MAP kinase-activated protein kinase 2 n=1 Tax=Seminavis robusta TaxID=568900 RepID=A0A9N8EPP6_9STRA
MSEEEKAASPEAEEESSYAFDDSKNGKTFAETYVLDKDLGRGAFSVVKVGHHQQKTGESFAIKIITKAEMYDFDKECLKNELAVMKRLPAHDHIVQLYDVFDETDFVHLILEKVDGGELLDRLINKENYTECEARDLCKIVMEAMTHCHKNKVAHRDIKPENILMASETDDSTIKIADFGFAKFCPEDDSLKTQCGSAMHVAPEILTKTPYGTSVDCWALGVVIFTCIGGYPPFYGNNNQETFKKILKGEFEFTEESFGHITQDCQDMITGLLTMDMKDRWSTQQCLDCAWMKDDPKMLKRNSLLPNLKKLAEFSAKRKFKGVVNAVKFARKLSSFEEVAASSMHDESEVMHDVTKPRGRRSSIHD